MMEELHLGGNRYVRDNANEPWRSPDELVIRKTNLDGLITYYEVNGEIFRDIPPNNHALLSGEEK